MVDVDVVPGSLVVVGLMPEAYQGSRRIGSQIGTGRRRGGFLWLRCGRGIRLSTRRGGGAL